VADPSVAYVATQPREQSAGVPFAAEAVISFGLMLIVLCISNVRGLNRYTALFAGALVATCITLEAPISGMGMNPARTPGSALPGHLWAALWIYVTAPPLGMLLAAEIYARRKGHASILCWKLHHDNGERCIFRRSCREPPDASSGER